MQSVVDNVKRNGVVFQWSADITEHAHITHIKDPARADNNQNYKSQVTRHLDRADKVHRFDLATSIREAGVGFGYSSMGSEDSEDENVGCHAFQITTTSTLLAEINPVSNIAGPTQDLNNYFIEAARILNDDDPNAVTQSRTFVTSSTAFHLNCNPNIRHLSVDEVAGLFKLPDLHPSLADHIRAHS